MLFPLDDLADCLGVKLGSQDMDCVVDCAFELLAFVGGDVVEVAPAYDIGQITALAAAHIAYEFLALYAARPGGPAASS